MIEKDRALLKRLVAVNTNLGQAVVEICSHSDGGELPADRLRALGNELAVVVAAMLARADELDRPVIDAGGQHGANGAK